ncbi:Rho guanine nucleotide exchange factor 7 [Bagarius yarrelli]|uniref:Rho guanine nucleotide exchange factor 7 n=1 Tax=Bagarius yarrelli TaxID=175774 RepID=A0A556V5H9_BAGYA|nr:Rho guanine nucleotide exchange factor 7 [Bagarius yarrelli]
MSLQNFAFKPGLWFVLLCYSFKALASCKRVKTQLQDFSFGTGQRRDTALALILPADEELKSNGQTVIEEKSLVDVVYSLKDEVQELKQDGKKMKRSLEEEQRARKDLERIVRKVLKNMNDPAFDETTF